MIPRPFFLAKLVGILTLLSISTGCALTYTVRDPVLSSIDYGRTSVPPVTLTIVDLRTGPEAIFVTGSLGPGSLSRMGTVPVTISNMGDPVGYLAQHLEKEFASRKVPVKCVVGKTAGGPLTLEIIRYQIINRRATGFSPWEACHVFSGNVVKDGQKTPIKTYFYGGKTPVWSMDEILEPCFNIPISIIIKEVASKINRAVFKLSAPDEKVERLTAEINSELGMKGKEPFWKVLELGYTNNHRAMEPLKKYAQEGDEFFKSCALTAIGTLGGAGQLEFLMKQYGAGGYNDKYMAAKAIGDIGTPEASRALDGMKIDKAYANEGGLRYCVDLYAP